MPPIRRLSASSETPNEGERSIHFEDTQFRFFEGFIAAGIFVNELGLMRPFPIVAAFLGGSAMGLINIHHQRRDLHSTNE